MPISFDQKVSVTPDTLINIVGEESVLLNLNSESYYGLDEVGTRMWTALTTSDSIRAACETLLTEYQITAEALQRDLEDFVENLIKHGLVSVGNGSLA